MNEDLDRVADSSTWKGLRHTILGTVLFSFGAAGYLIPLVVNYLRTPIFVYSNAWDEITYLSYLGASVTRWLPGYWFSSWLVWVLHKAGVSGAVQNLLLDLVCPCVIWLFLSRLFERWGATGRQSLLLSTIAIFWAPVMNFSNATLASANWARSDSIVVARETFLPVLRSPQPQISWVILSVLGFVVLRTRRVRLLWFALPFLYWTSGLWCLYGLLVYELYLLFARRWYRLLAIPAATVLLSGFVAILFATLRAHLGIEGVNMVYPDDVPRCSLVALVLFAIWALCGLLSVLFGMRRPRGETVWLLGSAGAALTMVNLNLLAGALLDLKSLEGYEGTMVAGVAAAWLVLRMSNGLAAISGTRAIFVDLLVFALGLWMLVAFVLPANGWDARRQQYRIVGTYDFGSETEWILDHPTSSVIPDRMWRSSRSTVNRLTLARPRMTAPLFAYQYGYQRWSHGCPSIGDHALAYAHVKATEDWDRLPQVKKRVLDAAWERLQEQNPSPRPAACPEVSGSARLIEYRDEDFWITFP